MATGKTLSKERNRSEDNLDSTRSGPNHLS